MIPKILSVTVVCILFALSVESCSSRASMVDDIEQKYFAYKTEIDEVIVSFAESNSHILSIDCDDQRITVSVDSFLRAQANIEKNHLLYAGYDELSKDSLMNSICPELKEVVSLMTEMEIEQLNAMKGDVHIIFAEHSGFSGASLVNFPYHWEPGLLTEAEMIERYEDPESHMWIYKIDDQWSVVAFEPPF